MEWLWADLPPERAAAALRVTLHELRRALAPELEANAPGSPLVSGGETIRLVLDDRDHWDAAAMLRLARPAGDDEPAEAAIARLRRAEALYGGPFLPEWPYDEWARGFRAELEETHREILEQLADALARAGRVAEAIRRYRRLVGLEPEREGWHRALMRCYASAGNGPRPCASTTPAARCCCGSRASRRAPRRARCTPSCWPWARPSRRRAVPTGNAAPTPAGHACRHPRPRRRQMTRSADGPPRPSGAATSATNDFAHGGWVEFPPGWDAFAAARAVALGGRRSGEAAPPRGSVALVPHAGGGT